MNFRCLFTKHTCVSGRTNSAMLTRSLISEQGGTRPLKSPIKDIWAFFSGWKSFRATIQFLSPNKNNWAFFCCQQPSWGETSGCFQADWLRLCFKAAQNTFTPLHTMLFLCSWLRRGAHKPQTCHSARSEKTGSQMAGLQVEKSVVTKYEMLHNNSLKHSKYHSS